MKGRHLYLVLLLCSQVIADPIPLVTGEFEPFTGENLEGGGPVTQQIIEIFEQANIPVTVDFRPWKRGFLETLSGKYRATFPYSKNPEREKKFLYSAPLDEGRIHFYASESSGLKTFSGYDALQGKELCMPVGHNLFEPVAEAVKAKIIRLSRLTSMEQCFEMVKLGRMDMTMVRHEVAESILGSDSNVTALFPPVMTITEHVIFPINHPESLSLLDRFNTALRQSRVK